MSTYARRVWGPLTEGLDVPRDLDLGNRARALRQLGIKETTHTRLVAALPEHLPHREAVLLVSTRQWPLLAARMHHMNQSGIPVDARQGPPYPRRRALAPRPRLRHPGDACYSPPPRRSPPRSTPNCPPPPRLDGRGPLPLDHHPTPPAAGPVPAAASAGRAVPAHRPQAAASAPR
ncbi:hypothetical protein [Streptomyces sp. NPDC088261]|uniref:hypothetical protein n=1 Tax=Streptomyces sp. NPDC088261 TaxID=3365851 RepID=UPI0037FD945E